MLKLFVIELIIVFILILIACRLKKHILGIAMLVAVALGFACTANSNGMIFWAPVIFGIPILIAARGRSLPLEKRKHLEEKYAYMREPSPIGALFFGFLSLVTVLIMFSSWIAIDLNNGQLAIDKTTWWGIKSESQTYPARQVTEVKVNRRWIWLPKSKTEMFSLSFIQSDGKELYCTTGNILNAKERAARLNEELQRLDGGEFEDWYFLYVLPGAIYLGAFLFMTFILARGLSPRNKQEHPHTSVNGISLTDVLK